jgi:glycosyltransferase involved in cell wall biosynthesis
MLSACIIAKNEEAYIGRLLASLEGCPEIVVVDTGSTDRTLEVVAKFPNVKVRHFAWNGSFSDARNAAASHATLPWVAWLDADMQLPPGELGRILAFLPRVPADVDGLRVKVLEGAVALPSVRIYRRGSVRFRGAVHEDLDCKRLVETPFGVRHQRAEEPADRREKDKRYEQMLLAELAADPKSTHALLYLRDLTFGRKEYTTCRGYITRLLQMEDDYLCHYYLAVMEYEERRFDKAVDMGFRALRASCLDPRPYVVIADAYEELGRRLDALVFYEHARHLPEEARLVGTRYPVEQDDYDVVPLTNMAKIFADMGRKDKALACYEEALRRNPRTRHWTAIERNHTLLAGGVLQVDKRPAAAEATLTVVVPVALKRREHLRYTLDGLLASKAVKRVVVVNGSGERFPFPRESGKLFVVPAREGPGGTGRAWNTGMQGADTEHYLLLEEDVLCRPSILEACCNVLAQDAAVGAVTVETMDVPLEQYAAARSPASPQDMYIHCRFSDLRPYGWFVLGRTRDWAPVPEDVQAFFAADWVLDRVRAGGSKTAKLVSETIGHPPPSAAELRGPGGDALHAKEKESFERRAKEP